METKELENYFEIEGDLIGLAKAGFFDVIAHGCNCFCIMGAGIAPQMADNFNCHKYRLEEPQHRGDINKLGCIEAKPFSVRLDAVRYKEVMVVNAYTQYTLGKNHKGGVAIPLDYEALTLCMRKINHLFKGFHVGLPQIGCGLAGGDWERVKKIIQEELTSCKVTIVIYKPN